MPEKNITETMIEGKPGTERPSTTVSRMIMKA